MRDENTIAMINAITRGSKQKQEIVECIAEEIEVKKEDSTDDTSSNDIGRPVSHSAAPPWSKHGTIERKVTMEEAKQIATALVAALLAVASPTAAGRGATHSSKL